MKEHDDEHMNSMNITNNINININININFEALNKQLTHT